MATITSTKKYFSNVGSYQRTERPAPVQFTIQLQAAWARQLISADCTVSHQVAKKDEPTDAGP